MAIFDSADCLAQVKALLNRPTTDASLSDTVIYGFLTRGQSKAFDLIATHAPWALYGDPELLTTSDGGETYDFGSTPFHGGRFEIRSSRNGYLLTPGPEWDPAADFTWEGDKIRIPDGRTRTFPDGPYARYIAAPTAVASGAEPTLRPVSARVLMIDYAAELAAHRLGTHDPRQFRDLWQRDAWGDLGTGEGGIIPGLKTQLYGQGLEAVPEVGGAYWWRMMDRS